MKAKTNTWADSIGSIFRNIHALTKQEEIALLDLWSEVTLVKRGDFLISVGDVETRLFFVAEGTMRIYYPHDDEEICVGFAHPGNLICSYPSFIKGLPSDYFIQALTKTKVVSIKRKDFYNLFDRYQAIERCWRRIQEEALIGKIEREVEMLTFTPEERYHRLLQRSPHIFQLIPRKYLASYLRMTPETLSRISSPKS